MTASADPPRDRDAERLQIEEEARIAQDADQTAADLDQTQAGSDQSGSEADQLASDADQILADRDQHASDRDQAAADWESSHTGRGASAQQAHEKSRRERDEATRERGSTEAERTITTTQRAGAAARRQEVARVRDHVAAIRDRTAQARDDAATARDRVAEVREHRAVESGTPSGVFEALQEIRVLGATLRERAALDRAAAANDRTAAAADRERGDADLREAGLDELTGLFRRGTGELALGHEIDRCRRTGGSLVLAMISVDALETVNAEQGRPAGDELLRTAAVAITATLRGYDVAVRWSGDAFMYGLSDVGLEVAANRLADIQAALGGQRPRASIRSGVAELGDDDTLASLVARAADARDRSTSDDA